MSQDNKTACPSCGKLYINSTLKVTPCCGYPVCSNCIEQNIKKTKICPYCKKSLKGAKLIAFSKMKQLLETEIQTPNLSQAEICLKHNKQCEYYCPTCNVYLCSDCIFEMVQMGVNSPHNGHDLKKTSEILNSAKQQLDIEVSRVKDMIEKINQLCATLENNSRTLNDSRDETILDMFNSFKAIQKHLDTSYKEQEDILQAQINDLDSLMKQVQNFIGEAEYILTSDEPVIVMGGIDLIQKIQSFRSHLPDFKIQPLQFQFENELMPSFETYQFKVENLIESLKQCSNDKNEEGSSIYSPIAKLCGARWRTKIYPHVIDSTLYLALFIEMLKGYKEAVSFVCRVEILHPEQSHNPIQKQYSFQFKEMEAWGWHKMAQIKHMLADKYINADGSITIKLSVRPESFYQAAKQSEQNLEELKKHYKELKSQLREKEKAEQKQNDIQDEKTDNA